MTRHIVGGLGSVLKEWQTGVVVSLFKKGDQRMCATYRSITLLSLPRKVYSKVLERRVRPIVKPRTEEEQCRFGRSRTRWRDYISSLAWELLGIPQAELADVAGEREVWGLLLKLLPLRPDFG